MKLMNSNVRSRAHWMTTAATVALLGAASAQAQDDELSSDTGAQRDVIVVTAQKREQTVFDVPASVTVVSGDYLEQIGATTLADYAALVPGLNFSSGGSPGQGSITLRGVSPLGSSSSVGVYLDDAPLGSSGIYARSAGFALDLFPYDIERIEVVRGPQGTLYGASAMGGILKYVSRRPNLEEFEARAGGDVRFIEGAGDASFGLRGNVSVPIVPGVFAVMLSGFQNETAGYIDNTMTGENDTNAVLQQGARLTALLTPSTRFSAVLTAMAQHTESDDNNWTWTDFNTADPLAGDLESQFPLRSPFDQDLRYFSATLNYSFDGADLTAVTAHSSVVSEQIQDVTPQLGSAVPLFTGGLVPAGLTPFLLNLDVEKLTQELRLASSEEGRFEWLIGAYYAKEDVDNNQTISALLPDETPISGLHPLGTAGVPSEYEEFAIFGDVTVRFSDRFDVTAGLRWTENEQTFNQLSGGALFGFVDTDYPGESSEEVVTYMVSPRFAVNDDVVIYGRYATGYRPGGPNVLLPNVPPTVEADTIESFELGLKAKLADGRLAVEASVYQNNWSDIQTATGAGGLTWLVNSDSAEIRGFEFSSLLYPADGLEIGANVAYVDAEFVSDSPGTGAVAGDPLPLVPEWQGAATLSYERPLANGLTANFGGAWRFVGDQVTYDLVYGSRTTPSFDSLDLRVGVSSGPWSVRVFANNVLDERAHLNDGLWYDQVTGAPLFTATSVSQPRTLGLSLDVRY